MSFQCKKCNDDVTDFVLCGLCEGRYHFGCGGIAESTYRKMGTERKAAWRCLPCRNPQESKLISETQENTSSSFVQNRESISGADSQESTTLAELCKEIKLFRADFKAMKTDFDTVKIDISQTTQVIQDLSSKWSELESRFGGMNDRLVAVEEKVTSLATLQKDLTIAKNTISELKYENNLQDQFSRQNNLEISGVPSKKGENLHSILNDLCQIVNFKLTETDVDTIHRVRPFRRAGAGSDDNQPTRPSSIIVRFTQRRRKDQLIAAVRARRGVTTADIGLPGPASNLFVNDHLTPTNKLLLKRARELKAELNYSYLWVKDSKILMRKNDNSNIIRIAKDTDLLKVK